MSYERPAWAGGAEMMQQFPQYKAVNLDVGEFIRTRDALASAYLGLSASLDRAVKAYLDHTQVVLNGDASLNVGQLLQPFNVLNNHAQMAQLALQQQNGGGQFMLPNGNAAAGATEEPEGKKKRKKRPYKQRDPNAPKRPLTAYFRYLGENRPAIQQEIAETPDALASGKPGDISKIATDRWNALSKEDQEPYRVAYREALKDYELEVARYKAQGGDVANVDDTTMLEDAEAVPDVEAVPEKVDEEDSDDDDDDDSDDDEEVAAPPPPPPPPPQKAPKSALKKSKQTAVAAPDAPMLSSATPVPAPSSSPERKRKADADSEGSKKKHSRRSNADKEVVAASDPVPAPVAAMASSPPASDPASKKKKDKKKKRSGDA